MQTSTITAKGQVTIPRRIREQLRLEQGTRLAFHVSDDGRLIVEAIRDGSAGSLAGLLSHLARSAPVSAEQMRAAVRKRAKTQATDR